MMVTGCGLHHDADKHGEGEKDHFDDGNGSEARKPVDGLAHGQSIVDAIEVRVALTPEQLCGVESRNNEEEKQSAALDRLDHEGAYWPDADLSHPPAALSVLAST